MKPFTTSQMDQAMLAHSLKNLAAQLDLCALQFADISQEIGGLSQNVRNASYVSAHAADSCLMLLEEISASCMTTAKMTFKGDAAVGIVEVCKQIKMKS